MSASDKKFGDDSFEALEAAVLQSPKGRWFLDEYARRVRTEETHSILEAIKRLERAVAAPQPAEPQTVLKPRQLNYFKQDEEIFVEARVQPQLSVVEKAEPKPETRGAHLKIERAGTLSSTEPQSETLPDAANPPVGEVKQRVVIIRKPASEDLSIPLVDQATA
jgi:uncharacterized protein (DUF1684 family)